MKLIISKYLSLVLLISVTIIFSGQAQTNIKPAPTLKATLEQISRHYHVNFLYEEGLIATLQIGFNQSENESSSVEAILNKLLLPIGLSFYHSDHDNYVIYRKLNPNTSTSNFKSEGPSGADSLKSGTVIGIIQYGSQPLPYSTVILMSAKDSTTIKVSLSDSTGLYTFRNLPPATYMVAATQVGYSKHYSGLIILGGGQTLHVPPVILPTATNQLKEVKITARKPLFEQRVDRTIVNVESSALAAGGSVTDVLEISPGIAVDNNQITLKGKQGVTVMIDDKVVKLPAADVASLLQNMPASSIAQIELISNPSAKYDAQGKGGIINIKTKKGTGNGFNGSITTALTIGVLPRYNESLILNYKVKNLSFYSNYSFQAGKSVGLYQSNKSISGQHPLNYFQDETEHGRSLGNNGRLGLDYQINDKNSVGILGTVNIRSGHSDFLQSVDFRNVITQLKDSSLTSQNSGKSDLHTYGLNINSRHVLGAGDHILLFNADLTSYRSVIPNNYMNSYFNELGAISRSSEFIINNTAVAIDLLTAKLDYSYPVNKTTKLEAGLKTAYTHSNSAILFQNGIPGNGFATDSNRSNTFDYKEHINAGYLNFLTKLGSKTDFQVGVRAEQTNYRGKSITTGETVNRKYLQFFPSAFLVHHLAGQSIGISYSRRIGRPDFEDLNPFIDYESPYFYTQGNPLLRPETTQSLELNYTNDPALNISFGYSRTSNYYNYFTSLADSTGATRQTIDNFKNYDTWDISLNYNKEILTAWNITANGELTLDSYQTPYLGAFIDVKQAGYIVNILNSFQLTQKLSLDILNLYRSKRIVLARTIDPKYRADAALKYTTLGQKGIFKIGISDIFYTYLNKGVNQFQNLYGTFYNRNENRRFNISFTYKFGGKAIAPKKKQSNEEEINRIKS